MWGVVFTACVVFRFLGKFGIASGREEDFKACAVSFGSNQSGSVLLAVFLRSRPCSDSLSVLPTSKFHMNLPSAIFAELKIFRARQSRLVAVSKREGVSN